MLSVVLFGSAFAACGLSADIDPAGACVVDSNGFATLDADSDASIPISLVVATKGETTAADKVVHPATVGSLSPKTDDRYILSCPQASGLKTVMLTITRPAALTEFGGEWVQMFPKDSWSNVTNEYEPYSFNEYGAKIPLAEFRPTSTGLADDAPEEDTLNVFMEVSDEGDYEFKYGNPQLVSGDYWVAVEFKSTLLRVGTPWADCTGYTLASESVTVGAIMPVLFGGPNLNSIALKDGFASYDAAIAELAGASMPVKVVLEIFTTDATTYTSSAADSQCYKAGNACPEAHAVCDPSYCEMDVWAAIIADFKAASSSVAVLGSVGTGSSTGAYSALSMDGFYFVDATAPEAGYTGYSVVALGSPLFDDTVVDDADVYVTLSGSDIGIWNPFSWYPYVAPAKWAAIVTDSADASAVATLVDRGYGYVYLTSEPGFDTKSTMTASLLTAIEGVTSRRLQGRNLQASEPYWGCDDTLFECKPVCMKQTGVVTTKVADTLCAGAPKDLCACKCFHNVQWACEKDAVVCKAQLGAGELQTVGDKVCETRGAVKPESTAELTRVASQCEPMKEMRGSSPTQECLAQWEKEETETEKTVQTVASTAAPVAKDSVALLDESFAAPLALAAALALYA
jgi:hypothetical protein